MSEEVVIALVRLVQPLKALFPIVVSAASPPVVSKPAYVRLVQPYANRSGTFSTVFFTVIRKPDGREPGFPSDPEEVARVG